MKNPLDFTGKVALVTGAGSGKGLATARAFAESGAAVVLADAREEAVNVVRHEAVRSGERGSSCGSGTARLAT